MLKQLNGIKYPGVTLSVPDSNLRVFTYLNFKNSNNQKNSVFLFAELGCCK